MDAQSVLTLIKILVPIVLALAIYNAYLVFKLKDVDPFENWDRNKWNGAMFLLLTVLGLPLSIWSLGMYKDLYILIYNPASDHGVSIDSMFWTTTYITTLVYLITNAALFYFAFRYRSKEGRKALYYPENNKLEIIWTAVPAIVLTLLIASGISTWWKATGAPPAGAREIELTGKQFDWSIRYPGNDGKFGIVTWDSINDASGNPYGYHFSDKNAQDDFNPQEIHLEVGVPVKVNIRAKDVLHSATFPHFRMKMDAVPGMTTSLWFTPTISTDSMRSIHNNPKFNYELSCQEVCGGGHWNMRRVIVVESKAEYEKWLKEQKATYIAIKEQNAPAPPAPAVAPADAAPATPATPAQPTTKPEPKPAAGAKPTENAKEKAKPTEVKPTESKPTDTKKTTPAAKPTATAKKAGQTKP